MFTAFKVAFIFSDTSNLLIIVEDGVMNRQHKKSVLYVLYYSLLTQHKFLYSLKWYSTQKSNSLIVYSPSKTITKLNKIHFLSLTHVCFKILTEYVYFHLSIIFEYLLHPCEQKPVQFVLEHQSVGMMFTYVIIRQTVSELLMSLFWGRCHFGNIISDLSFYFKDILFGLFDYSKENIRKYNYISHK